MLNQKKIEVSMIDEADCKTVWLINNDPDVRAMSFSQEFIPYENHVKWFHKKITDKNSKMYKFIIDGEVVGLSRLDIEKKLGLVSIAVKQGFRGKGIGSEILKQTIILAKELKLKKLLAEIKLENHPSLELFKKNGFLDNGTTLVNKEKAAKMAFCI